MGFVFTTLLYIGFTLLSKLLRPELPTTEKARRDQFALPTTDPSRPIPIAWGTVYINDPNIIWWGSVQITNTVGNGNYTNVQTNVDIYMVCITAVICHGPVDITASFFWDDLYMQANLITYNPVTERSRYDANRTIELIPKEHWIYGIDYTPFTDYYYFYRGTDVQVPIDYEALVAGVPTPAYKGVAYVFMGRTLLGSSASGGPPSLKRLAVQVVRRPNDLGVTAGHESIGYDANPACMLYDAMTNARWGMGMSSAAIDVASFRAAGETLYTEGSGMSLLITESAPGREILNEILRHIDGAIYTDPLTGLLTLKLARNDYDPDTITVLDKSNVTSVELSRPAWGETKNHVRVKYTNPSNGGEFIATETNLANVQLRGGIAALDINYPGFSTAATAQRAAARDLKTVSYPFARVSIEANRIAALIPPNGVFKLNWEPLGIIGLVCRVTRIAAGTLLEGGIHLDAVEDAFAVDWTGLEAGGGEWQDPVQDPTAVAAQRLEEAPYGLVAGNHRKIITLGAAGAGLNSGYAVWSDPTGGTAYTETNPICVMTPMGPLRVSMGYTTTSFSITVGTDIGSLYTITDEQLAAGRNLLLIDDEWIAWKTFTDNFDGTYTLSGCVRGVLDTTPKSHSTGVPVWFPTGGAGLTKATGDYASDVTVQAKLRTINQNKTLPLASATAISTTTTSRTTRPYVPCAVKLNTLSYPHSLSGELTVSWSHRDRTGTWTYDNAGATGSPEAGTTYTVKVYGDGGTLKHTEAGITGTSYLYPAATESAENGGSMNSTRRITVQAFVSALASRQLYDYTVGTTGGGGWGYDWGFDWGL